MNWLNAHPKFKSFLVVALKNAVNAILTNSVLMAMLPTVFHMHSGAGWWNILKLAIASIGTREAMVWGPKLLKWSSTNGNGAQ